MGWALERIAERGLHADHRAVDGARAGVPQPGAVPGPQGRNVRDSGRRTVACGNGRGRADLAAFGRDHRGRQAADPLCGLFSLLPPRGGQRGQGRARAAARPPVREGRAIRHLRGRRGTVGDMARAASRARREYASSARNSLSGDRDLDRRHGSRQVPDERHRKLGAEPRASIARPTAARRCTTGRRGGRTSATAAATGRCVSRTRSTIRRLPARGSSFRCWRTTRRRTAA